MRRRTVFAALGAAASASALAACGSKDTPSTAPSKDKGNGKLVIWADPKRTAVLKKYADQFGKDNGITVEVKEVAENLQTVFVTASEQGSGPDVVVGAHDWIGNLVQNGAIDPVQLSPQQKAAFAPAAVKAVTFNGQTYGAPYALENIALVRNTDLAPTAPATFDDLIKQAQDLKKAGKVQELLLDQCGANGDVYHIYPIFSSAGGSMFGLTSTGDPDPKNVTVNSADSIAAFTKLKDLGEKGVGALKTSISDKNVLSLFTGKKAAFFITGAWNIADIKKAGINYDITPIPAFSGGKPAQPFLGVQAFFVAAKGKSKSLAQEFVANYVTNKDVAMALYEADPRPPALLDAIDAAKASDPDVSKWLDAGKDGLPMPAIPEMAAIWGPVGNAEVAAIKGNDPKTAADAAAKAVNDAITKK